MPIVAELSSISTDLLAYGEDDVARWVLSLSSEQHDQLGHLAAEILYRSKENMYLAKALALAAVQMHEGAARPLKRKRRMMHVYEVQN